MIVSVVLKVDWVNLGDSPTRWTARLQLTNAQLMDLRWLNVFALSGPHKCNATTIQLQYKEFFLVLQLYCTFVDRFNRWILRLARSVVTWRLDCELFPFVRFNWPDIIDVKFCIVRTVNSDWIVNRLLGGGARNLDAFFQLETLVTAQFRPLSCIFLGTENDSNSLLNSFISFVVGYTSRSTAPASVTVQTIYGA